MFGTAEAAGLIGCTPNYIKHLCQKGKLEGARKTSGVWLIPEETITTLKTSREAKRARKNKS